MEKYTFDFLQEIFPELAEMGRDIENIFYQDPQSVLIKGRIFAELLLKRIAEEHELYDVQYLKQVERIQKLEREDILSKEISRSFDTVRYLGNKAAHEHIESGLESAFKMHKNLFQIAVWFMEVYGSYEFVAPKYRHPQPKSSVHIVEKLEEKISASLEEKLKILIEIASKQNTSNQTVELTEINNAEIAVGLEVEDKQTVDNEEEIDNNFVYDDFILGEGESYLLAELSKLKESSQEAIENPNEFSSFKDYLHVERTIQNDMMSALTAAAGQNTSQLIFLCGSVGDGKSHLLSYVKNKYPELMEEFSVHNDATESFDPQKSSLDTLAEVLKPYSDSEIDGSRFKLILAINLGVLHNFIESDYAKENYRILTKFIEESGIFEANEVATNQQSGNFHLISFSDYQPFELTSEGPKSNYFSSILKRIVVESEKNPFYQAYLKDKQRGINGFFMVNYELLQQQQIRDGVLSILIEAIVKHKMIISTRSMLNFIYDILVPSHGNEDFLGAGMMEKTEALLPNLLFDGQEKSNLLAVISKMDPIHLRSNSVDQMLIELNNSVNMKNTFQKHLNLHGLDGWIEGLEEMGSFFELSDSSRQVFNKTLIRLSLFLSPVLNEIFGDENYKKYMEYLYAFNKGNRSDLKDMYNLARKSIFLWNGSPKADYVFMDYSNDTTQVAQSLKIKPFVGHLKGVEPEVLNRFKLNILLAFSNEDKVAPVYLEIDYPLYEMMVKLSKGYRPNKKDKEDCIQFVEFVDKIMKLGNREKELLFVQSNENGMFRLTYDEDFEEFTFRRD
ncbi:DNA phosphorothioation-dependent restriction protein DptF [Bacillus cereus]|uniref:DNA phosphorothioation-dependent restriction protein DptF n=1 Tax=Bacillus TaxID=1386 RepID=UPI0008E58085|nr:MULTISPECIES: DNA phosphorothioation-dependent restriction protein DptF [Bacillus]MCU5128878.1 DNA phosphorothioation-dependent restriction protein DptF [Bacillus cereus]MCU5528189.1 DNA phosphorothioation-dependent restriction protein DptF [Bacillus cereus]MCU5544579.1 DNA phosphorothioation-dependent restriction protein DptF [Bacillus cereus]MED3354532.1 DNA phosphorothioation-dependent restriction protein DptF [Bacillus thuringiensis]PGQ59535.1 DNA phosphorothioation-dependent restrictio